MNNQSDRQLLSRVAFALLPIAASLLVTTLLILAVGSDPRAVFEKVWEGAFRTSSQFAAVVNFWIPLTLCGIGLIVTFTAGLWNIGIEGQISMGAVFASWGALFVTLPSPLQIPFQILLAMLGGALWALLVGVLKTRLGVHEIFGGVALNALANLVTIYLVTGPWSPGGSSKQSTDPFGPHAVLPPFSSEFPVNLFMLFLVALAFVIVFLILRGTRWGLQLKATGKNSRSALLLGVPTTRSAVTALMLCGAIAGIAGAHRVMFTYNTLRTLSSGGIGFLALLVVLLVSARLVWVPFVTFAFAAILAGSTRLKIALQLDQSLAGVIQGLIVLMALLTSGLRQRWQEIRAARASNPPDSSFQAIQKPEAMPNE